jgi:hypothetical protein
MLLTHTHTHTHTNGFPPEGGVDLVPKRGCLLTLAYYAFPRWYEFGQRRWNDTDRGKPKRKKPVPVPLSPPQIPHGLTRGVNLGLRGERPATNDLSHGNASHRYFKMCLSITTFCGRSRWPLGLRRRSWPLACWNRGFESRPRHGCLSLWLYVTLSCVCRGLCDELIPRPKEYYTVSNKIHKTLKGIIKSCYTF